MKRATHAGFY